MNLEYNIVKMEEQVTKLKSEIASMKVKLKKQDKLKLKGGSGYYLRGWDIPVIGTVSADTLTVQRGSFRATKELAELADRNMVTRNRLEAYVHQIQGDGEGNITISFQDGRYIAYSRLKNRYPLCTVFMQEETAEILCEALNQGKICL